MGLKHEPPVMRQFGWREHPAGESSSRQSVFARAYRTAFAVIPALVAASTLISILQSAFEFELAVYFEDFLQFYHSIVHPILGALYRLVELALPWLRIDFPGWVKDLHALSFTGAAMTLRAVHFGRDTPRTRSTRRRPAADIFFNRTLLGRALHFILAGGSGVGLIYLFGVLGAMLGPKGDGRATVGWASTLAVVAFYAANGVVVFVRIG